MNRILAIDFDGTVHDNIHPLPGRRMGVPSPGAKEALEGFKKRGDTIIIFSVWGDKPKAIADWMQYYKIPYDSITNIKPHNINFLIDDKAVRFTTWNEVIHTLDQLSQHSVI